MNKNLPLLGLFVLVPTLHAAGLGPSPELDAVRAGAHALKAKVESAPPPPKPAAPSPQEVERVCRVELAALVTELHAARWTCTSRCSSSNLWLLFGAASGPNAQAAYDALADTCEARGMHIVDKQVSCLQNYSAASFHEDLDSDCARRTAVVKAELTTPRMRCTAKLYSRGDWPYEASVSVANAAQAWVEFAALADRRDFSFKSFAPASDCPSLR